MPIPKIGHNFRTVELEEVSFPDTFVFHPRLQEYLTTKISTHYQAGQLLEFASFVEECSEYITNNPTEELHKKARHDAEAILELGVRYGFESCRLSTIIGIKYLFI